MKSIFCLFFLLITASASAESVLILEMNADQYEEFYRVDFRTNKKLGRAWVDVVTINSFYPGESTYHDTRTLVEGLSYDESLKAIVYDNGQEKIPCVKFRKHWASAFGWGEQETGRCQFRSTTGDNSLRVYMTVE